VVWQRAPVATAIAATLATLDASVSVFAVPPTTLNPPAYLVGFARRVDYDAAAFGVDLTELVVSAAAGLSEPDRLDQLLHDAKVALNADPSCGGTVAALRVRNQDPVRLVDSGGATFLVGDLILEIRS
jgi:hypothetical protein